MFWKLQENALSKLDLQNLVNFIETAERFTQSTNVAKFEAEYAQWQGCEYCVYVNSGSSANLIMIAAASEMQDWPVDAEVLVPAVTCLTSWSKVDSKIIISPIFLVAVKSVAV